MTSETGNEQGLGDRLTRELRGARTLAQRARPCRMAERGWRQRGTTRYGRAGDASAFWEPDRGSAQEKKVAYGVQIDQRPERQYLMARQRQAAGMGLWPPAFAMWSSVLMEVTIPAGQPIRERRIKAHNAGSGRALHAQPSTRPPGLCRAAARPGRRDEKRARHQGDVAFTKAAIDSRHQAARPAPHNHAHGDQCEKEKPTGAVDETQYVGFSYWLHSAGARATL